MLYILISYQINFQTLPSNYPVYVIRPSLGSAPQPPAPHMLSPSLPPARVEGMSTLECCCRCLLSSTSPKRRMDIIS